MKSFGIRGRTRTYFGPSNRIQREYIILLLVFLGISLFSSFSITTCFLSMAAEDAGRLLANAKKRRGAARASLTRLSKRLKDLEGEIEQPKTLELARRLSHKLTDLDSEFPDPSSHSH